MPLLCTLAGQAEDTVQASVQRSMVNFRGAAWQQQMRTAPHLVASILHKFYDRRFPPTCPERMQRHLFQHISQAAIECGKVAVVVTHGACQRRLRVSRRKAGHCRMAERRMLSLAFSMHLCKRAPPSEWLDG